MQDAVERKKKAWRGDGRYEMDAKRCTAAVLAPMWLYGSETWVLQKKNERKINVVEVRSLGRIYGVSLAD